MVPTDFMDALDRLISNLSRSQTKLVSWMKERNLLHSFVGAWFHEYRPSFLNLIGEEELLLPTDDFMQQLLKLSSESSSRRKIKKLCKSLQENFRDNLLIPLSRAYWSHAPERAPAGRDEDVLQRLSALDEELGESYEQVVEDLTDESRKTYKGTAAELREIIRGTLVRLAPDDKVKDTDWYKEARKTGTRNETTPTQGERTKFILRERSSGSAAIEAAESYRKSVEERLGNIVRASYRRASNSAHSGAERDEVARQLQYANALLGELLPQRDKK